jgi:hypothetical protein
MKALHVVLLSLGLVSVAGCDTPVATYDYGVQLNDVEFNLHSVEMGVYPSLDVLGDPGNPFATTGMGRETKWDILSYEAWPAVFYAWATFLTQEPTGEAQFYTATAAANLYAYRDCEPDDLYYVRQIAIDGFQAVLDEFPESVTYDATGTYAYPLAPLAYQGIVSLGGVPKGWALVTGEDGTQAVVPIGAAVDVAEEE